MTDTADNDQAADKDEAAAEPVYTSEAATKSAVAVVSKSVITGPALSLPAVGGSATTVPGMGETEDEKKGVKRAARVKLMWERFSTRQLILCAVKENSLGTQVPTIMRDISKCLNNSSRALFLKLRASAFLAVGGPTSTWSDLSHSVGQVGDICVC